MDPSPCGAIRTHPDRPTPEPFHHEMGSDPHRDWDQPWQWDGEVKPTPQGLLPTGWSKEKWKQRCPSQKQSALVPAWSLEGGFVFMPSFGTQNYARTQTLCPGDSGEVRMWGFGGNILHGLGLLLCSSSGNEVTLHPGVVLQDGAWGQQGNLWFQQGMGELSQQSC